MEDQQVMEIWRFEDREEGDGKEEEHNILIDLSYIHNILIKIRL